MRGKLIGGKQPPWVFVTGIDPDSSTYADLKQGLLRYFTRVEHSTAVGLTCTRPSSTRR